LAQLFVNELSPDLSLAVLQLLLLNKLNFFLVGLDLRHEPNLLNSQVGWHVGVLLCLLLAQGFFIETRGGLHWQFHFGQIDVLLYFKS
jgi:hypothetical protein